MSSSYATTTTRSFSLSNAKYIGSKVRTDLQQCQRWYGAPSDADIADYHDELVTLSAGGYVDKVKYGFRQNGRWLLTLEYTFRYDGTLIADERAGGVRYGFSPNGAAFTSYLYWSSAWRNLSEAERDKVRDRLPFRRTSGDDSLYAAGRYVGGRTYSADGSGASRTMFVPS